MGAAAGYYRGWVDVVILRVIETMLCFPGLVLMAIILSINIVGDALRDHVDPGEAGDKLLAHLFLFIGKRAQFAGEL